MSVDESGSGEKIIAHVDSDLEDLIPEFMELRRKDIISINKALEEGDYKTIEILGHSMKGSGGGYGFDAITEIGKVLEIASREPNDQEIKKQVALLSDYIERVEIVWD